MKRNEIKIEFLKDYANFSKGDTAIFKKSLAHYIVNSGNAKIFKAKAPKKKKVVE